MAKVVASNNLRAAAENEGQALLITKTKAAEADGNAIKISSRGRKDCCPIAWDKVLRYSEKKLLKACRMRQRKCKTANLDSSFILFSMWTESIRHFAEQGKGNTIFLDGSVDSMKRTMQELMTVSKGLALLTKRNN